MAKVAIDGLAVTDKNVDAIDFRSGGGVTLTGEVDNRNSQVDVTINAASVNELGATQMGFVAWLSNPNLCTASTAPTSQRAYAIGLPLRAGQVVTNVVFATVTAGAGTAPSNIYCGLANSSGTMLGVSADVAANSGWTTTAKDVHIPLTTPVTISTNDVYFAVFLQNGSWGTTAMTLLRGNANFAKFGSEWWLATENSRTDLATALTFSTSNYIAYWAGVS